MTDVSKTDGLHIQDSLGEVVNGWFVAKGLGRYGTYMMKRPVAGAFGWRANLGAKSCRSYTDVASGREEPSSTKNIHFADALLSALLVRQGKSRPGCRRQRGTLG
jgi:hypothetical protein